MRAEQVRGQLQLLAGLLDAALPRLDTRGEQIPARELRGVVGRLQERNSFPDVVQRLRGAAFDRRGPRDRPVEANSVVRVGVPFRALERIADDLRRALV